MGIQTINQQNQNLINKLQGEKNNTEKEDALLGKDKPTSNYADYAQSDKVSVSYRAAKLDTISKEFFSGYIRSDQIPALTERLYQEGFLTDSEFQQLGGTSQKVSAISQAQAFTSSLIYQLGDNADKDTAKELINLADVLANINAKVTPELRAAEKQAMSFVEKYSKQLEEEGADSTTLKGFKNLTDVLNALEKIRNQEQSTGALAEYGSVQDAYDDMQKNA